MDNYNHIIIPSVRAEKKGTAGCLDSFGAGRTNALADLYLVSRTTDGSNTPIMAKFNGATPLASPVPFLLEHKAFYCLRFISRSLAGEHNATAPKP